MLYKKKLYLLIVLMPFLIIISFFFYKKIKDFKTLQLRLLFLKINENFEEKNYLGKKYRLSQPLPFKKGDSKNRKYPLIVFLHGSGARGSDNKQQLISLRYLGNNIEDEKDDFYHKYPSFVYAPQCPAGEYWNTTNLSIVIDTIENLKNSYPIDNRRLYLIGFSMGGSGVYKLAEQYYNSKKHNFAAIIRMAGQSSYPDETHKIIAKSSVWLHIGQNDTPLRVAKAREAYQKLKMIHSLASESSSKITIPGEPGITHTLFKNKIAKVKLSEYYKAGHFINIFPYKNEKLLIWLFDQKLEK